METNFNLIRKINVLTESAYDIAKESKSKYVSLEHFLDAFLHDKESNAILKEYKIDIKRILNENKKIMDTYPLTEKLKDGDKPVYSKLSSVFLSYYFLTEKCNVGSITDDNMLFVTGIIASFLLMEDTFVQKILMVNKVDQNLLTLLYQKSSNNSLVDRITSSMNEGLNSMDGKIAPNKMQEFLEQYTINLTEKVSKKDWIPIVGRDKELELLQQVLLRHDKPNAIIVGKPGIGKTKMVEGLAKIYKEKYPDKVFYQLDTLAFMANILLKGEMENRVKNLYNVIKAKGNVILFIDEIHSICGNADSSSQSDVSNLLKPLMNDGDLKIIGATTNEEYRKYIEKDSAFTRRFFKMNVEEPSLEETKTILMNIKSTYENVFNVKYTESIIDLIIDSCTRYFASKSFPDKAIDMIDTVGAYALYNKKSMVTDDMIYRTLSTLLNIPLSNISQSEEDLYKNLEENMKKQIIGQDEAVEKVSDAVVISRSGLRETNKTASSLMFKGPSGVGKTETCQVLSKLMNIPLIRFDMSEYMEEHSVSKLIGSPPGYKGFADGKSGNGLLINAIDEHPNCILLLDEIEKANSKIHNILLQVMDNGKLTSSSGKSVSFEHVFLIMTSNVGSYNSHKINMGFGVNNDESSPSDKDYEDRFLPEFRNRIDATVSFNNLPESVLKKICIKFLDELTNILYKKSIDFNYSDSIVDYITNKVKTMNSGARPIKHIITNEIKNKIAKDIVFGKYKNGGSLNLDYFDNKIYFGE